MRRRVVLVFLPLFLLSSSSEAAAQAGRGMGMGTMGGPMMGRDSSTMAVMRTVHELLMQHDKIRRTVTNLANGIRTVTESEDSTITALIQAHVTLTGPYVLDARDFRHPMASEALHRLLANGDKIVRRTEVTRRGVLVEETSSDPAVVALLQTHAAEVTALVERGMAAMHEAMMKRRRGG